MTPLAGRIVRELTLPLKKRSFRDQCQLSVDMANIHCFDVTEVIPLAEELMDAGMDFQSEKMGLAAEATSFLPAPGTWIEFLNHNGIREGYHIAELSGATQLVRHLPHWKQQAALRIAFWKEGAFFSSYPGFVIFPLGADVSKADNAVMASPELKNAPAEIQNIFLGSVVRIHAFLALINTPRIIGRQQHMPNAGLERRLLKNRSVIGNFPLNAWTVIKLKVHAPANVSDDEPVEAHLTGHRALHFCRAHLRIKMGRVEFVKAHWRGDASLGIKQSRYTVTPK